MQFKTTKYMKKLENVTYSQWKKKKKSTETNTEMTQMLECLVYDVKVNIITMLD